MKRNLLLVVSCMALLISVAASGQILGKGHSEADAVKNALKQADLQDVTVSDDADKNTITLSENQSCPGGEVGGWQSADRERSERSTSR